MKGFWSYVHKDDEAESGRIAQLARDIVAQYELITGDQIELFLDKDDLSWGDDWRITIDSSLSTIAFFVPVLTPRYFKSSECRRELQFFARRAEDIGVKELVLPILYANVPELNRDDPPDDLMTLVKRFQWEDWTSLRFLATDSPDYRMSVAHMAQRIAEANQKAQDAEIPEANPAPLESGSDDAPGRIDRLAITEATLPEWQATLEEIGRQIEIVGQMMQVATRDVTSSDARGKGFAGRVSVARNLSNRLSGPAGKLQSLGNDFSTQLYDIDAGVQEIIRTAPQEVQSDPGSRESLCEFFGSVLSLSSAISEALDSVAKMINSIEPLLEMSRDLRPPLKRMRRGLVSVMEAKETSSLWAEMINSSSVDCTHAEGSG